MGKQLRAHYQTMGGRERTLGMARTFSKSQSLPLVPHLQQGHASYSFPNSSTTWEQVCEPRGAIFIQSTTTYKTERQKYTIDPEISRLGPQPALYTVQPDQNSDLVQRPGCVPPRYILTPSPAAGVLPTLPRIISLSVMATSFE